LELRNQSRPAAQPSHGGAILRHMKVEEIAEAVAELPPDLSAGAFSNIDLCSYVGGHRHPDYAYPRASGPGVLAIGPNNRSIEEERRVQVLVRDNNVDQALKVLKKKMQREGVFREMKRFCSHDGATKRFEARRVDPMHILKNHQHRIRPRQRLQLCSERFQRFLSPLRRGHFDRGIAAIVRQRQHFGNQCRVMAWRKTLRQQGIEFVQLRFRCVVVCEPSSIWLMIG